MSYICPIFLFKLKLTGVRFSRFQPRTLLAIICFQDEREDTLTNGMFKKLLPSRLSFTKESKNGKNSKPRPDTIKFCRGDTAFLPLWQWEKSGPSSHFSSREELSNDT